MTCEAFLDRLYDDDARAAQRGQGPVPTDMAGHMSVCEVCRAAFASAVADEALLATALLGSPSPAWRADVLRQIARAARPSWTQRIATVNEVVTWGILGVATSHVLLGEGTTAAYVMAFCTGGAAALLYPTLRKQRIPLLRPRSVGCRSGARVSVDSGSNLAHSDRLTAGAADVPGGK